MNFQDCTERVRRWAADVRRCRRGGVAVLVAIATPILFLVALGGLDYSRAVSAKQVLQNSLDAATLFAARSTAVTDAELQAVGDKALAANLINLRDGELVSATFRVGDDDDHLVVGTAQARIQANILGVFGQDKLLVGATTEVMRSAKNVEVALVLDVTGSMAGQRIVDLRAAAKELVDLVVKDQQTPYYSKVAIVPYSMGVNVGSYANAVRGSITPGRSITGATRANPVVITAPNHGLANGAKVHITGVSGMTQLNNNTYTVANRTAHTFALSGVNGNSYGNYSSGGTAYCTTPGCEYHNFTHAGWPFGGEKTFRVTSCVSERTGPHAYTDMPPGPHPVGRNYASPNNPCIANTVLPLSSNKTTLTSAINALQAGGSTAGHVGVAWGWYMVSPNFASLLPTASRPAPYGEENLQKVVVLMTDGEYNSAYCDGVIARDSTAGSGSKADQINCDAHNGHSFDQAQALCNAIKAAGVVVYTVGFNVVNDQRAEDLVEQCATDPAHVFFPTGGAALKDAFRAIAVGINDLRIAR